MQAFYSGPFVIEVAFALTNGRQVHIVTNFDIEKGVLRIRDYINDGYIYEHKKLVDTNAELVKKGKSPIRTDLDLAKLNLSVTMKNGKPSKHKLLRSQYFVDANDIGPSFNRDRSKFDGLLNTH